ncbi:MAG: glutamate--tRNA ligase [Cystobacterineae bacterium]|nr:glutamate--tRNA ligase [Cystobacterineae bacterium]
MSINTVRVRFAPSPTGYLHIGGARTALFNWLYARGQNGLFILRVEDTDQSRSTPESVETILEGLRWLGLNWDEGPEVGGKHGPYFQMRKLERYREVAEALIANGHAYRCCCTKEELEERRRLAEKQKRPYKYEGLCRDKALPADMAHVVRFKVPQDKAGSVCFQDQVLGRICKQYADIEDFILLRNDGIPLYNFGCVVDDHDMDIGLVGRGQEHINSTFGQMLLFEALGWQAPQFAHFPLILGKDREKLSKRLHPEADLMQHRKNGILPQALLNFIVRLGWSHQNDETFTLKQMVEYFGFNHVGKTSGVWNPDKLLWLNQYWMKNLPPSEVAAALAPFLQEAGATETLVPAKVEKAVLALRERSKTLVEMARLGVCYFQKGVHMDAAAKAKHLGPESLHLLRAARERLAASDFSTAHIEAAIREVAQTWQVGLGKVAQPIRVAVTGQTISPGISETLELLGREETLARMDAALQE